jgi:hypothetical protein
MNQTHYLLPQGNFKLNAAATVARKKESGSILD